jgi:hypothetical protein
MSYDGLNSASNKVITSVVFRAHFHSPFPFFHSASRRAWRHMHGGPFAFSGFSSYSLIIIFPPSFSITFSGLFRSALRPGLGTVHFAGAFTGILDSGCGLRVEFVRQGPHSAVLRLCVVSHLLPRVEINILHSTTPTCYGTLWCLAWLGCCAHWAHT